MRHAIPGIHHVTAITSDAQSNLDFYTGILGLRLVKLTINFDDPGSYHLYYGDRTGTPGSILTFFAWPGAPRGRHGTGQVLVTSFSVPGGALEPWRERLLAHGLEPQGPIERFEERVVSFEDPDGLRLELVEHQQSSASEDPSITTFYSVTLAQEGYEQTARLLTETFGFDAAGEDGGRFRYEARGKGPARRVDLLCLPDGRRGSVAAGTVHHVAWRATDDSDQQLWRQQLVQQGFNPTPVMDRKYFHSIYFREPGGVLFEIATDPPGFSVDEPVDQLGSRLQLPEWLEPQRARIERALPPLNRAAGAE